MKHKKLIIGFLIGIIIIAPAIGAFVFEFSRITAKSYKPDVTVWASNGDDKLIIREYDTIGMGCTGIEVYYKSGLFKKSLGELTADEMCFPFTNGEYIVTWEENSVTVRFYSGRQSQSQDDPLTWDERNFELS